MLNGCAECDRKHGKLLCVFVGGLRRSATVRAPVCRAISACYTNWRGYCGAVPLSGRRCAAQLALATLTGVGMQSNTTASIKMF